MYFTVDRASGGYRAHFYGSNGKLVWWSEVYTTKANAEHAVYLAQTHAASAPYYDRT